MNQRAKPTQIPHSSYTHHHLLHYHYYHPHYYPLIPPFLQYESTQLSNDYQAAAKTIGSNIGTNTGPACRRSSSKRRRRRNH